MTQEAVPTGVERIRKRLGSQTQKLGGSALESGAQASERRPCQAGAVPSGSPEEAGSGNT